MKEVVNDPLVSGDIFMPEMQPGFTSSAGGPFTKNRRNSKI